MPALDFLCMYVSMCIYVKVKHYKCTYSFSLAPGFFGLFLGSPCFKAILSLVLSALQIYIVSVRSLVVRSMVAAKEALSLIFISRICPKEIIKIFTAQSNFRCSGRACSVFTVSNVDIIRGRVICCSMKPMG